MSDNYSSVYDIIDKGETATKVDTEKTVSQNNNSNNREFPRYEGVAVDQETFNRDGKSLLLYSDKEKPIPEDVKEVINTLMARMVSVPFKLRTNMSDRNPLDQLISGAYPFKEVFLPFAGFNKDADAIEKKPSDLAFRVAINIYLNTKRDSTVDMWNEQADIGKLFDGNRASLILGKDLKTPVEYIITYSSCGTTKLTMDTNWDAVGWEIPKLLKISNYLGIKFFNLGNKASMDEFKVLLDTLNK